jgi:hypothetical protein
MRWRLFLCTDVFVDAGGDESLLAGEGGVGAEHLEDRGGVAQLQVARVTCDVTYPPLHTPTSQKKLSASEADVAKLKQQMLQQQLVLHTQQHDQQKQHAVACSALQQQLAAAQLQIDALTSSLASQKQVTP